MVEQMREFGLFGATIPTEYGGLGLSTTGYAEIVTQISAVWMSLTGVLNSHLMMAHLIRIVRHRRAARATSCPQLAAGELRGGLALTEPDCGHRPAGDPHDGAARRRLLRRQRHEDVDHQRRARQLPRAARQDRSRSRTPHSRGMSVLLVRKDLDGYTVPRKLGKLGYKGVDTVEVVFDDVHVDA